FQRTPDHCRHAGRPGSFRNQSLFPEDSGYRITKLTFSDDREPIDHRAHDVERDRIRIEIPAEPVCQRRSDLNGNDAIRGDALTKRTGGFYLDADHLSSAPGALRRDRDTADEPASSDRNHD